MIFDSILDTIGNTPVVKVNKIGADLIVTFSQSANTLILVDL